MSSGSKEIDPALSEEAAKEVVEEVENGEGSEDEKPEASEGQDETTGKAKKKKSKKSRMKAALTGGSKDGESSKSSTNKLTPGMVDQLLEMNPSLKGEVAGMGKEKAVETLKKLDVSDLLTGMVYFLAVKRMS
jgi:glycylpeptide N-tetradecanoyltransferase